ncbi:glycosyltransferase family 2 protein [Acidiferrobacter sp.]|uniref:glycosyltransferase family 2 protein n=1 Tax=Acidiferrobacter sp. TaxID=1872107 RepID=UPI002602B7CA|nr:glycosyltransferase family 2 protein [Acidiferrobacter sp.]
MAQSPTVGIVMPAYKAGDTIREAVDSVVAQAYQKWELLVVADDGFDYAHLLPVDPRMIFLNTGRHGAGPSAARNLGLERARQPLIAFLDSDDTWYPDKLSVLAPLANEHGIALDNVRFCYRTAKRPCGTYWDNPPEGWHDLDFYGQVSQGLWPVYRRDLIGSARFQEPLRFAEDAVFNLSLIARNRGAFLCARSLHEHKIRPGSLSQSPASAGNAEQSYTWILEHLRSGNHLFFPSHLVAQAVSIFEKRRDINRAFIESGLVDFQDFETRQRAQ